MLELDLRFYKRYDVELIALHKAGVPLGDYVRQALIAYTTGKPFHIYIPFALDHDFNDRQLLHTSVKIEDTASEHLLRQIKHGYRNSFCKLLLRDALIYQNLAVFHSDAGFRRVERERIAGFDPAELPGTIIARQERIVPDNPQDKILKKPEQKTIAAPKKNPNRQTPPQPVKTMVKKQPVAAPVPPAEASREEGQDFLSIFKNMMESN